jgi:hypothetical protein
MACRMLTNPGMTSTRRTDTRATYEHGQDIRDRTFMFACRVIEFCQTLYEQGNVSRLVVAQLIACSTSTATMLEEAKAAV